MSFKIKKLFGAIAILLMSLIVSGCGGGGGDTAETPLGDLVSINVTSASSTVIEGLDVQLTANGSYSSGQTVDITSSVNWVSSDTAIATVGAASGLVTAQLQGTVTITATTIGSDGVTEISGSADLIVNAASLTSITVTPATATVVEGLTQSFVATGNYDDGSSVDLSASVNWTSSDNAIATVDASGLAIGIVQGTATITATSGTISGSADLTVNAATLTSIAVSPATATVVEGLTQAFVATGNYNNGSSADISASVNWTSNDVAIATVDASGLATGVAAGSATITATSGTVSGSADLTVNAASLTSIAVTPATATVIEGLTQAFVATGNYDNGSSADLTASVTWTSSDILIATVNASGLSTGVAAGTATITATSGAVSGTADLTVNAATLTSISVTPATASVIEGLTQTFVATGNYDNGSSADITASVIWTSSDVAIATVNASGLSAGVAAGTATITATSGAVSGTAELTVNAATLTSISVTPVTATVIEGLTQAFVATGNYDNSTSADLTASVTWTSSDILIATVNASGLSTGVAAGTATITATSGAISGTAELTVNTATLLSIAVSPATATVVEGLTQAFVATGNYDNSTSADISGSVAWTSSNVLIATVNASGLSTGVAAGTATITATSGGSISGTAELTVEPAPLVNDTFSINIDGVGETIYTETANGTVPTGFDPMVYVQLDQTLSPVAATGIVLVKNYIAASNTWGQTHFLTFVGDTASTLTFASGSASAFFADTQMEMGDDGTYAPGSISVSSYGAVGELVVGSYDVNLCEFSDLFFNACGLGSTNYTGAFSAIREPNAGSNERPKPVDIGTANAHHVSDLHGGINVYSVDVVAGAEYVIDVTGLSADVLLTEYNNDASTYMSGTPGCFSNNTGTTDESCTVTALGSKLYFTIGGSDANYTVTVSEPVIGGLPDLSIVIDSAAPSSGFLQVNYTITNNGPADLVDASVLVGAFVDPAAIPVVGDTTNAESTSLGVNLVTGASTSGSLLIITAPETSATIYLTVDQNSSISEADESNNVSAAFSWAGITLADEGTTTTPVTLDASTVLPYSGTVDAGSSYYEITGLTAANSYTISAAIDNTGDVVLSVWTADPAGTWDVSTACVNDTTASGTESCEIIAAGTSVWVMVNGWNATPSDFILNAVETVIVPPIVHTIGAGFVSYDVQEVTYVDISVTAGTTYTIKWDDSYEGTSTYTGDVQVSAKYADTTAIFTNVDSGYTTPQTFTATQTGIVTITLDPAYSTGTVGLEVTSP